MKKFFKWLVKINHIFDTKKPVVKRYYDADESRKEIIELAYGDSHEESGNR